MNYLFFSRYSRFAISILYFILMHFVYAATDEEIDKAMIGLAYSKDIYRNIGRLCIYENGKRIGGASVTYLGDQICLSAGHNFYGGQNRTYQVGFELQEGVFTFYDIDRWEMHSQFKATPNYLNADGLDISFDIMMLHLKEPVIDLSGIEPCYDSIKSDVMNENGQEFSSILDNDISDHSLEKSGKRGRAWRQNKLLNLIHVGYGIPYRRMTRCEQRDGKRRASRSYFLAFVDDKSPVSLFSSPAPLLSICTLMAPAICGNCTTLFSTKILLNVA